MTSELVQEAVKQVTESSYKRFPKTDNRRYGFWGTFAMDGGEDAAEIAYAVVGQSLVDGGVFTADDAVEFLDSTAGRHLSGMIEDEIRRINPALRATEDYEDFFRDASEVEIARIVDSATSNVFAKKARAVDSYIKNFYKHKNRR